jgi:hypothetical protein
MELCHTEKSVLPPDSTTGTSASMTMYFAPVSFLRVSLAASWSQCAWLIRRILMSVT